MNELLATYKFIPFNQITPTKLNQAITYWLKQANEIITNLESTNLSSWSIIANQFYPALYHLNQVWNIVHHLLSVNDSPSLRALQDKFQPLITEFYVSLEQNEKLYSHFKHIKDHEYTQLDQESQKVIDNKLREFFLNGINLNSIKKARFKEIQSQLSQLTTKFEQNLLDATDNYTKFVTQEELNGIPNDVMLLYKEEALKAGKENAFKLTLHLPSYLPIMQYADNRELRQELYYNYVTRASELGNSQYDNSPIIQQILSLRQEKATLLGFTNYTNLSLYTKMAQSGQQVLDFLYQLADKSKAKALADLEELTKFAKDTTGINQLEAWDILYFSEKLQQHKYNYSTQELKQYFPLPIVVNGLFNLIKQLYQIQFSPALTIPIWHNDLLTYAVIKNHTVIGYLYLDLYARNGKQPGAWMNSAQDRYQTQDLHFQPMAYIICNFTPPIGNKPSLLTFDEIQTLFHEMGHALHHLLSQINHYTIAGINEVEWDAVELPSQLMEYFTWNYSILTTLSKHIDTQEAIPFSLYTKLLDSRFYQAGLQMLRQLEFAIFDILLHNQTASFNCLELLNTVQKQIAVVFPPSYNRFPNTFSHIFAGGYAAGYYSYKWAEVLAADIFSLFDTADVSQYTKLGNKFLHEILSQGGLNPMLYNFKQFMQREPQLDALLKYSGIKM